MKIRNFVEGDREQLFRIWQEVGWISEDNREMFDIFIKASRVLVGELQGEVEVMVASAAGDIKYLEEPLPLHAVAGVTTGIAGRKKGLAGALTAQSMAREAQEGKLIAALGMFEQGYYNRLGFGNGSYEREISFDPVDLQIPPSLSKPYRLFQEDYEAIHENRLRRFRHHGSCSLHSSSYTRAEMMEKKDFGIGFRDSHGVLTHHLWISPENVAHGPYEVRWAVYEKQEQFLELLAALRDLGDQVHKISINEPSGMQLQDLLRQPFKKRRITREGNFAMGIRSLSYWQIRMLNLEGCLEKTRLNTPELNFNLQLTDPVEAFLPEDSAWKGIGGAYTITLGPECKATKGLTSSLPTLTASVGAFSRLWFGVLPCSGLALTDELQGSPQLLAELDRVFRLPRPSLDWDF